MSNFKNGAPSGIVLAPAQNQVIQFRDEAGTEIQISQQDVHHVLFEPRYLRHPKPLDI